MSERLVEYVELIRQLWRACGTPRPDDTEEVARLLGHIELAFAALTDEEKRLALRDAFRARFEAQEHDPVPRVC